MFTGIYLLRESQSQADSLAITYVVSGQCRHCKIVKESRGGKVGEVLLLRPPMRVQVKFTLLYSQTVTRSFASLKQLVLLHSNQDTPLGCRLTAEIVVVLKA